MDDDGLVQLSLFLDKNATGYTRSDLEQSAISKAVGQEHESGDTREVHFTLTCSYMGVMGTTHWTLPFECLLTGEALAICAAFADGLITDARVLGE